MSKCPISEIFILVLLRWVALKLPSLKLQITPRYLQMEEGVLFKLFQTSVKPLTVWIIAFNWSSINVFLDWCTTGRHLRPLMFTCYHVINNTSCNCGPQQPFLTFSKAGQCFWALFSWIKIVGLWVKHNPVHVVFIQAASKLCQTADVPH